MSKLTTIAFYLAQAALMVWLAYGLAIMGTSGFSKFPNDVLSVVSAGLGFLLALVIVFRTVIFSQFVKDVVVGTSDATPNVDGV